MRPWQKLAVLLLLAGSLPGQDAVIPATARALRLRFGNAATRALANFRSADSIEDNLRAHGNTLHPTLIALRLRIEAALDEGEAALNKGDLEASADSITRAEALVEKFGKKLGGD